MKITLVLSIILAAPLPGFGQSIVGFTKSMGTKLRPKSTPGKVVGAVVLGGVSVGAGVWGVNKLMKGPSVVPPDPNDPANQETPTASSDDLAALLAASGQLPDGAQAGVPVAAGGPETDSSVQTTEVVQTTAPPVQVAQSVRPQNAPSTISGAGANFASIIGAQ